MIVYVESNFVLELALGQEQAVAAEAILALTEQGSLELAFPGFALSEPFATVTHRGREQVKLSNSLSSMVRELRRSTPHQQAVIQLNSSLMVLRGIATTEMRRLEDTAQRLLNVGTDIHLDATIFREAMSYRSRLSLSSQDSIVYASIVADLRTRQSSEAKFFISKNWRDFRIPAILTELRSLGCQYVDSFDEGLILIRSQMP